MILVSIPLVLCYECRLSINGFVDRNKYSVSINFKSKQIHNLKSIVR